MLESLKKVAGLAGAVGSATFRVADTYARELANLAKDQLPSVEELTTQFEKIGASYTPIPITARCVHGENADPNDYLIEVDIDEIATALNAGRKARPQLTVYAKYPDTLDRDLLAERLEDSLKPLIKAYEDHIAKRRAALRRRKEKNADPFWIVDIALAAVMFPPVLVLLMAVSFADAVLQLPSLISAMIFGDDESRLDAKLAHARLTVKKVIRNITIKPLP